MIQKQISNQYLNESKIIKAKTYQELELKIKQQKKQWKEKEKLLRLKDEAKDKTDNALALIQQYRTLLLQSLNTSYKIDWHTQYQKSEFKEEEPKLETFIKKVNVPKENKFIEFFFSSSQKKREEKQREAKKLYYEALNEYLYDKNRFYNEQKELNNEINLFKEGFEKNEKEAVERYVTTVLNNSQYPKGFIKRFELGYNSDNKSLIIEYSLPSMESIPIIIEHKFIQTKKEIVEKTMKKNEVQELYDDILYQITLRTIYECFNSDYPDNLQTIVFNGWIHGVDVSTGAEFDSRIISILVNKEEFMSLNLNKVIVKDCFRRLNGKSSSSLHKLSPIKPILELNKVDERFIESRDVLAEINSIPNLAEMEWDDFEHLVSNLFSLYFKEIGDVKITRKSREGGIDGVIFDSDPIRGGKYLIQAKRYNDIVPPSAVRELCGSMHHEKATRGILITTGYFGPDANKFGDENNITLIDGSRLVYMLNEYGYHVRCEIQKSKKSSS